MFLQAEIARNNGLRMNSPLRIGKELNIGIKIFIGLLILKKGLFYIALSRVIVYIE
jgi:hypothetical protein